MSLSASTSADASTAAAPAPLVVGSSGMSTSSSAGAGAAPPSVSEKETGQGEKGEGERPPLDITSPHELTAWVEDVLTRLEGSFDTMSTQVLDRLETISKRIDTVEQSISDLMQGNSTHPPAGSGADDASSTS